jgi:GDP-D-mannose 3', 5'-epimerase
MDTLVCGAGGFLGGHLIKRLQCVDKRVWGVDVKKHWWQPMSECYRISDCREDTILLQHIGEVYNMAADMGGMGYLGDCPTRQFANVEINARLLRYYARKRYFFPSSACVYPDKEGALVESDADVNQPSTGGYGWEKLYSEKMTLALGGHTCRLHNCYGPYGSWNDGREKAPAAMLRKAWQMKCDGRPMEVWGDGTQRRVFTYVDDAIDGILAVMESEHREAVNVGSEELVSINDLVDVACKVVDVPKKVRYVSGPTGVKSRGCDARRALELYGWSPKVNLFDGMVRTWDWMRGLVQ